MDFPALVTEYSETHPRVYQCLGLQTLMHLEAISNV